MTFPNDVDYASDKLDAIETYLRIQVYEELHTTGPLGWVLYNLYEAIDIIAIARGEVTR